MQLWQYKNFTINSYDEIDSTNIQITNAAKLNLIHHNHIITAKKQNAGKGRYERVWSSPSGNLYFSILLKPNKNIAEISLLSFIAAVALGQAISELDLNKNLIEYKWPNDILINGKKVAGILLESDVAHGQVNFVVVGIGVNINSNPDQTSYPATNLQAEKIITQPENLLKIFLDKFSEFYDKWLNYGFAPIRNLWLKNAFNFNKIITVNLADKKLSGLFRDFDDKGNLILELENKETIIISSGEI